MQTLGVEGADGQQVVAPGTAVEYTLRFRNKDTTAIDYQLNAETRFLSEHEIPIEVRLLSPEEDYILGSATEWVAIADLNGVSLTDTILAGDSAEYIFQWKWDFESGDDAYDTFLGNLASEETVAVEVGMSVYAAANTDIGLNGGFMKSGLGEIIFTAIVLASLAGSVALLITPPLRKKYLARKAAKAANAASDKPE